ncbi:ABC-type branched-chain amino acid transport system, ATPase component [Geosmithia morbida]|uniref:ABC-type branched-chain amino acid transport system, ATPase component n=1 Tax=Geosmithia morbida TaxID=1094350 RepID=A0A9P4Z2G1_9HYPO|nr:ABC-type branched-chain amino acid transport system, ATPase component [Geosmithia morbida]KAF4126202.1 ABC-type branched-chain amino acid transport system, ATPase component [Geosmithia morbida]
MAACPGSSPRYWSDGSDNVINMDDKPSSVDEPSAPKPTADALTNRFSLSGAGNISLDDVESVHVRIRDLAVSVDTAPSWLEPATYPDLMSSKFNTSPRIKTLLHSVTADLSSGTLTAIIGGSGSGKTTLLNTMAERVASSRVAQTGSITFNNAEGIHSVRHAYVMQQDILLPTLTVRETLQYAADLRLPPATTAEDRLRVVEDVIRELGLKECANTRIGNGQHRGCSGGEKRRVSIGVQLLANPSVLFLDEPTTGLDATSAFQLVRTLKKLAQKGRTVITTIHQPRSEIWDLFDNLAVLSKGSPVYSGSIVDCLPWFGGLGFQIPPFVNPAEFVIDIAAIDNRTPELEEESTTRVQKLKDAWVPESARRYAAIDDEAAPTAAGDTAHRGSSAQSHAGFARQLSVLTNRTLKVTYRDPLGMTASIFEAVIMGIICGYLFYDLSRDQAGIRSRQGALYTAAGLQGYLMLIFEVYRMTIDIATFDRESSENCVDALPYILSRRLARLPTEDFPVPLLYSVIFYFMSGFDREASKFFTFFAITLLNHYIAMTCAITCVAASRHFAGASLIANLVYTLQSMACGMFIQIDTIPVYVRWLRWITYSFYAFGAYCGNEFQDSFYDCPVPGGASDPSCKQYTGSFIMDSLGFPPDWVWRPIVILVAFIFFFLILATIGLQYVKVEMTIARARTSDTDLSAGKEKMSTHPAAEIRAIDLGLQGFSLDLDKRTSRGKRLPRKRILNPINATFQAGMLNVIMGPSGSGKTSLLNATALRLRNSVGTKYLPSGKLTFNGAVPSDTVIRSVCSYVCQDDDALLPSLTVRETLRFSAGLRLPSFMSKEEKNRRAEEVLMKMGLKDCADNLVGNEMVKGISGGEKRRVSIAIQVLTDPRILLLDEPTSGLDAFTANSIMEVLQGLAKEGRTLILTIHQARSDLFTHFGNVLLLARGGSLVYAGAAEKMIGYFSRQGLECPQHSNPADFALDMITIDLQQDQREAESRERVQKLVDRWETHGSAGADTAKTTSDNIHETETTGSTDDPDISMVEKSDAMPLSTLPVLSMPPRKSFNRASLSSPAELGALVRKRASLGTALPLLLHRAAINTIRQPEVIVGRLMQIIGLAIILALFFAPLHNDYYSVQSRIGFVQEVGAFYFVGMLQNMAVYPNERDVFYREDDDGVYGVEAFIACYTLIEVPLTIISCLVFGVLGAIAVGLPRTVTMYFTTVFACFGIVSCGESLGIMFNTVMPHTGFAINVMGIFLSVANSMAGILSIDMPDLFKAFNYLSPIRYGTRAMGPYSLRGVEFTCNDEQRLPNGRCPIETGEDVLKLYRFDVDPVVNIAALAGCIVVYRLLAWALLRVVRGRWREKMQSGKSRE